MRNLEKRQNNASRAVDDNSPANAGADPREEDMSAMVEVVSDCARNPSGVMPPDGHCEKPKVILLEITVNTSSKVPEECCEGLGGA